MGLVRNVNKVHNRTVRCLSKPRVLQPGESTSVRRLLFAEFVRVKTDPDFEISGSFELCVRVFSGHYNVTQRVTISPKPDAPVIVETSEPGSEPESVKDVVPEVLPDITPEIEPVTDAVSEMQADAEVSGIPEEVKTLTALYDTDGVKKTALAYNKDTLIQMCESLGLETEGTRAELVERIVTQIRA